MSTIVFLVLWLTVAEPNSPPVFQVMATFDSMKECTDTRLRVESKVAEAKNNMACFQIVTNNLPDGSKSF